MRDDLRKNMEEIEKLEANERKLQIDLNNQIIARNEAVSSLNTVKANLGVFKDEYKKMEESLKITKEEKSNLSNKINSLQVHIRYDLYVQNDLYVDSDNHSKWRKRVNPSSKRTR